MLVHTHADREVAYGKTQKQPRLRSEREQVGSLTELKKAWRITTLNKSIYVCGLIDGFPWNSMNSFVHTTADFLQTLVCLKSHTWNSFH